MFGTVYIHAVLEAYFQYARNLDRLRAVPGFLALEVFTDPPQLSDLQVFSFDSDDIEALKNCEPGLPPRRTSPLHRLVCCRRGRPSGSTPSEEGIRVPASYQREGNSALGVYNDKRDPTNVPEQFADLLS